MVGPHGELGGTEQRVQLLSIYLRDGRTEQQRGPTTEHIVGMVGQARELGGMVGQSRECNY